jgi:hypothetical protein
LDGAAEMMVLFNILFLISLNPTISDYLPGEWVGGDGFSESPTSSGNVYVNPALADTLERISVNFRIFADDYTKAEGGLSSASFNIPVFLGFIMGGNFNLLYDYNMEAASVCKADYRYRNYFSREGGMYCFGGYVSRSLGPLSLGMDVNILNGKTDNILWVDFIDDGFTNVYDTVSTYFRGYSLGLGFNLNVANFSLGGYFCPYQEVKKQYYDEEEEKFELDSPLRFGLNYYFNENKSVMFSINRREAFIGLNYAFVKLGYSRMYSMGTGFDVNADRFLGGVSFSVSEIPLSIMFESRRYSGKFEDNEFRANIGISISGKGRKNEDKF